MKVTDGKRTFDVTEKAYNVIYASLGYEPVKENDEKESKKKSSKKK